MEKVKVIILLLITSTQAVNICEGKNALNLFCLTFKSEEMWKKKKANMWRILANNTNFFHRISKDVQAPTKFKEGN